MKDIHNDFWVFCLEVYACEGVEAQCIYLQDQYGYDVVLLLFLLWTGVRGEEIEAPSLIELNQFCRQWQDTVVAPLRKIRRELKTQINTGSVRPSEPTETLRQKIKTVELESEKLQALALIDLSPLAKTSTFTTSSKNLEQICDTNLSRYATTADIAVDERVETAFAALVLAATQISRDSLE